MIFEKLKYWLLLGVFKVISLLPLSVLYFVLSPLIFFILYHLVGYRRAVVKQNLANAFPDKSQKEREDIERKYYHHLSDVIVDNIKISTMSVKEAQRRFKFVNADQMPNQDMIFTMGHFGSWEMSFHYAMTPNQKTLAIYRPLHSKVFDRYYNFVRCRTGATTVPMNNIIRELVTHRKQENAMPVTILMIADQSPSRKEQRHWHTFLNQDTSFFGGPEKMAVKFKLPIYFINTVKIKRGYYENRAEMIYDGQEALEDGQITLRYVEKLEAMILNQPENWVWSHRRWKHKKQA